MNVRIKKFREELSNEKLDGFIVYNPVNIRYLTGLEAEGILILSKYDNIYITDSRYIEEVRNKITIEDEIIVQDIKQVTDEDLINLLYDCERIGFEEKYITYSNYRNMIMKFRIKEAIEGNDILDKLREVKNKKEVEYIETACNITDSCFLYLQDFIKVGMTEKEIAFEIQKFFIENNADGVAFDSIVASGANTSMPHAVPTDKEIEYGDPILIDFGAKYQGYCADMTRMLFVGEIKDKYKEIYNIVLEAHDKALEKMKNGADTKAISNYVINEFKMYSYELIHALGHGVGLDVHEKPFFSPKNSYILKNNMVVTDEPGIYLPGEFGVRIEDTILINNSQPELLTKSNKNIMII